MSGAGPAGTGTARGFRLIVHPKMDGRLAMAVDETLAEAAGRGESSPVARLYGFSPPTLSLGRFQRARGEEGLSRLAADGVTLVRRPTGGHAVLHDDELTYAVTMSRADAERLAGGSRKREVYAFVARLLLAGLAELGIAGVVNASQRGDPHNPDCFGSAGEYEIDAPDGRKLVGSAQMTTRGAILQHGSIPLSAPGTRVFRWLRRDPSVEWHEPACLDELAGRALGFEEVRDAFARAFARELGAAPSDLEPAEREAAERLAASRYASAEWTLKS